MFDSYKLSDAAIGQIAKVLQVAILTGTDITDNLRLVTFVSSDGVLELEPSYERTFNENIEKMMSQIQIDEDTEEKDEPEQS